MTANRTNVTGNVRRVGAVIAIMVALHGLPALAQTAPSNITAPTQFLKVKNEMCAFGLA